MVLLGKINRRVQTWLRPYWHRDKLPSQVVILLTNPRSGSTWLLDTLRGHPAIFMHPHSVIYDSLGMGGRRYPQDLSHSTPETGISIEVRLGEWVVIPDFAIANAASYVSDAVLKHPYAIEKCHPHFFMNNVPQFLERVRKLEQHTTVKFIYQIRNPKDSLLSFLRYKARNPAWNAHRPEEQIAAHMRVIYSSIAQMMEERPGVLIDYKDLARDFSGTIAKILNELWADDRYGANGSNTDLVMLMSAATARKKREVSGTPFLDRQAEGMQSDRHDPFFATYAETIDDCQQAYRSILQLHSTLTP